MHVLPRVRELEERFPEELVVVGVHAGKFAAERITRNISAACERLRVAHPVVNDRHFRIWKSYAVSAWPTVALIDASGMLVGVQSGEFDVEGMAEAIRAVVERDRSSGALAEAPLAATPHPEPPLSSRGGVLRFPTRVLQEGSRMWISDAGQGRVVEAHDTGEGRWRIAATWDGFAEPQGLVRAEDRTLAADRAGHSVYRLHEGGAATRVAGTGRMGDRGLTDGPADSVDLRSPWGLSLLPTGDIGIAMAGAHQLWRLELPSGADGEVGRLSLLAGVGGEDIADGRAREALLAQPTGVALLAENLAFADCESSAVRVLETREQQVGTVVGTGLFDFGDRDGTGDEALLQHAQDLAWSGRQLIVTDTYNDRLKVVDPITRSCRAHPGAAGEAGVLWEPMGISAVNLAGRDGGLLVADTNNHRIVRVQADGEITPLDIEE